MKQRPLTTALGWRLPSWLFDYGPVAFVGLEGLAAIGIGFRHHVAIAGAHPVRLLIPLAVILTALVIRHRSPVLTLGLTLAVAVIVGYGPLVTVPVLIALFTLAEYRPRKTAIAGALTAVIALLIMEAAHGGIPGLASPVSLMVAAGLPLAAGLYVHTRADYVMGLTERAARLEREHELLADHAVAEERVRIARELHDVVAHNVSLMVVQAQALAATDEQPGRDASLGLVADLGREALSEMHRMLGVLRLGDHSEDGAERAPQPGVRDLEKLIARTREAGIETELVIEGQTRELPAGVDLSAYRIVQEALTNVIRHAGARRAVVRLSYTTDAIEVSVCDDGRGPGAGQPNPGEGHGLVGMRERVALFGGRLSAGPGRGAQGFQVTATLPLS